MAIPVEIAREIVRQAETRLDALTAIGTAADLRATTLCGIFGAAAVAITAGTLTYIATNPIGAAPIVELVAAVWVVGFFLASVLAAYSAAPKDWWIAGGMPAELRKGAWRDGQWIDEAEFLDGLGSTFATSINKDRQILADGARFIRWSLWTGGATLFLGVVLAVVLTRPV